MHLDVDRLRRTWTDASIVCWTSWVPDDAFERQAREPAHFSLHFHATRVTWMAAGSHASWSLEERERGELVELIYAVLRRGSVCDGVDTAVGRFITTLHVAALLPGAPGDGELKPVASLSINHYDPVARRAEPWRALVRWMEAALSTRASAEDLGSLRFVAESLER